MYSGGLRDRLKGPTYTIFTDHLMIVLALILIPSILFPFFFTFSEYILIFLKSVRYIILATFILEYFLKLYVAESRKVYASNPWHVIDLIIVILAATDFLPYIQLGSIGRASPILRLFRVSRTFAVAGRTVKRSIPPRSIEIANLHISRMKINLFLDGKIIKGATKEDVYNCMAVLGHKWIDLQEVSEFDIDFINDALKIPKVLLVSKIIKESNPKIDSFTNFTSIFIQDSVLQSDGRDLKNVVRNNMLILWADNYVITISSDKSQLFDLISSGLEESRNKDFIVRILYSIFSKKINDYEDIVRLMEQNITALEELPVEQMHPFLETSFQLKKEIQKIHFNLMHFRQVLGTIRTRKILPVSQDEYQSLFGILFDESVFLSDASNNIRDNLISLIDLHINTMSTGLNRVMKILAVITSIGLIPSIINGLFGENITGSPFPIRLSEIFFLELSIMLLAVYSFYRWGWLR
jgi:Mg2+ and Co2+ transporter CorA